MLYEYVALDRIRYKFTLACPSGVRPPGDYGQDCELSFGPIFTRFGTWLPLNISKKIFCEQSLKWAWPGSRDPLNFGVLSANSSKMVKATDFKFDVHVSPFWPVLAYWIYVYI